MFKRLFGLITVLSLVLLPALALAEMPSEEPDEEEDEFFSVTVGGSDLSAGADCFDYYRFNSVEIDFSLASSTFAAGEEVAAEAVLRNHNDYPLVEGGFFVQIFREKQDGAPDAGNYLVDEFWAAEGLALNAHGEKLVDFEWSPPEGLSGGRYLLAGHFVVAEKMNLSGLSFAEGIYGGIDYFIFEEGEVSEIYFDKETATVNDQSFRARSFIPAVDGQEADLSFDLVSLAGQDRTVVVSENLYRWDNVGPDQLIWSEERDVSVGAGSRYNMQRSLEGLEPGVYLLEASTEQSRLKIRFMVEGPGAPSRLNFLGLTDFPIRRNQDNSFFVCFHHTIDDYDAEGRVEAWLEDEAGNVIADWEYEGSISPAIMADVVDFTAGQDHDRVWLKGAFYQGGQLIDEVELFYDVDLFTEPAEFDVKIEDGQLMVTPRDMSGRATSSRLMVEVRDGDDNVIYSDSYYGDDLRENINFVAGQDYRIRVVGGGLLYEADYVHELAANVWLWLAVSLILLTAVFVLFKRRDSAQKQQTAVLVLIIVLGLGLMVPALMDAGSLQNSQISSFSAAPQRTGSIAVSTAVVNPTRSNIRNSVLRATHGEGWSVGRLDALRARTNICRNRNWPDSRNPCENIYQSGFRGGSRVWARHISLGARLEFSSNHPIRLVNVDTAKPYIWGDSVKPGSVFRLELGEQEGEWFFPGGFWDTPPVAWVEDAKDDFNQMKSIDEDYLFTYNVRVGRLGSRWNLDNVLAPKLGAAATDPLRTGQLEITASDNFNVYQEDGQYYLEATGAGLGEIKVDVPESDAYVTIDNLWFNQGTLPGSSQMLYVSVGPEEETLAVSLEANPHSGTAPLTVDLTATVSPDSTATGLTDYTFWCDCDYAGTDIEEAKSQCGDDFYQALEQEGDSYTASFCVYEDDGNYTPKVIVQRGTADAAQAQVADLQVLPPGTPEENSFTVKSPVNGASLGGLDISWISGTEGTGGTTEYTYSSTEPIDTVLEAPPTHGGGEFDRWSNCDETPGERQCRIIVAGGQGKIITAHYRVPDPVFTNRLRVYSAIGSEFVGGADITRIAGTEGTGGNTHYVRTLEGAPIDTVLEAAAELGGEAFVGWMGCDSTADRQCTVTVAAGETKDITAYYGQAGWGLPIYQEKPPL